MLSPSGVPDNAFRGNRGHAVPNGNQFRGNTPNRRKNCRRAKKGTVRKTGKEKGQENLKQREQGQWIAACDRRKEEEKEIKRRLSLGEGRRLTLGARASRRERPCPSAGDFGGPQHVTRSAQRLKTHWKQRDTVKVAATPRRHLPPAAGPHAHRERPSRRVPAAPLFPMWISGDSVEDHSNGVASSGGPLSQHRVV